MLWVSEQQANHDVTLFDMAQVKLIPVGRWYKLYVPGLAEGRPSVLKGDVVLVSWRGQCYKGRVRDVQLLDFLLEFSRKFHRTFNPHLDKVDIRFTFSRTIFRTSHFGCEEAPSSMGKRILFPEQDDGHDDGTAQTMISRTVGSFHWANRSLNHEQQLAIHNIVKGQGRPLPFILFGPPGTGKTTTIVEAVYQLSCHPDKLKILLVAPSNDAADILGAKLTQYFPPTELRRILAFSRSVEDLPDELQRHCCEGSSEEQRKEEIMSAKIVVSTVNLAARFSFIGVPKGHFDVLVVDEAGHAIEPEVIAVAASLIDYKTCDKKGTGQLILAGDPKQLGPVVSSKLCEKHGLSLSFMERLTLREAYARRADGHYPASLLTKLVRNYRSHPAILKLPNEMFYDNELEVHGDHMKTHSLCRWEHLAKQGFPVLFHAVHGENVRESNSPSWFNPQEAEVVVQYVDLLVNQTHPAVDEEDIGNITPYTRQVQKIRLALKVRDIRKVKVGSVETFQGQERRVIVLSTVRAESELVESHDKKYNLGFVANEKRFNVAVTRAQALLIVIGHPGVLETGQHQWLPLLRHCKANDSWFGQEWKEDATDSVGEESFEDATCVVGEENDDDDDVEAGVSHRVAQESVAFINREV